MTDGTPLRLCHVSQADMRDLVEPGAEDGARGMRDRGGGGCGGRPWGANPERDAFWTETGARGGAAALPGVCTNPGTHGRSAAAANDDDALPGGDML